MAEGWRSRFNGVRPGLPQVPARPAPPRRPAGQAEPSPTVPRLSLRLEGSETDILNDGHDLAIVVQAAGLLAHPPLVVDLVAFQVDGRGALARRLRLGQGSQSGASCTVRLLRLTDEAVARHWGDWRCYAIGADGGTATLDFQIAPSSSWLNRAVKVEELGIHGGNGGNTLKRLNLRQRSVLGKGSVRCPFGLAGLAPELCLELLSPGGECVAEETVTLRGRGSIEIAFDKVPLAPRGVPVEEGAWQLRLLLDGAEIGCSTIERAADPLFTAEGEIAIGDVPVARD